MRLTRIGLALLVLGVLLPFSAGFSVADAQEPEASYTSALFGYTITWDADWQLNEQSGDAESDSVSFVDGTSFVFFSGRSDGSDARAAVDDFSTFLLEDDSFVDTQPMADCPGGDRALPSVTACFTFLRLYDDGVSVPEAALLEAWDLGNGVHLLMVATVPQEQFAAYLPKWTSFEIVPLGPAGGTTNVQPLEAELESVSFSFDPGVSEVDQAQVVEGIRLGQEVIGAYLGLERLAEIQVSVLASANAEQPNAVAATLGYEIQVYTGSEAWRTAPVLIRIETLVHELTHVYQNQLLGFMGHGVPLWFDEGAAEAMGYLAITQLGVLDQDDIYHLASYLLTIYPVTASLVQFEQYGSLTAEAYPLSYIAVQYLLGRAGLSVSALGTFYLAVSQGIPLEQAFQSTFGLSLDEYYVIFDDWIPSLQPEATFPLDFLPPDGTDQAAEARWLQTPVQVERGDQLILVVLTSPGAVCTLDVQMPERVTARETFANGEGEAFWLVTIPASAPAGAATVTAECGAAPVSAVVDVR